MEADTPVRVVLTTAPDAAVASRLARALVQEHLAACVNLLPGVRSVYRWDDTVQEDEEVLLVIKTQAARSEALAARIKALHPYDVPEVVALPAVGGSPAYLEWVERETNR
jgi:periplasmic divalent cation tolerance protein